VLNDESKHWLAFSRTCLIVLTTLSHEYVMYSDNYCVSVYASYCISLRMLHTFRCSWHV